MTQLLPRIGPATLVSLCLCLVTATFAQDWDCSAQPVPPPASGGPPGIFVPPARGAGETLDGKASGNPTSAPDTVVTKRGDRLIGRVVGLGSDSRLRLTGPHFDGEVKVLAADLDQVELAASAPLPGKDMVVISNGDAIVGEVQAITADTITVNTDAAGLLKLPRRVVTGITFGKASRYLVDSEFDRGQMEPWKSSRGNWQVKDGMLVCDSGGSNVMASAPAAQDGPVTMEVGFEAGDNRGRPATLFLVLFADNASNTFGTNSVWANLRYSDVSVGWCQGGNSNSVFNRSTNQVRGSAVMRMAYDPGAQGSPKVKLWVNNNLIAECDVPQGPKAGKLVMVGTEYGCKIKYIRLTGGVSAPAEEAAKTDIDTINFSNKDHVSAKAIALADGQFLVQTPYGELKSPLEKVSSITFSTKELEKPRRQKGDVLVQTVNSRFTVKAEELDGQSLTGASDYLGADKVSIKRSAIKSIRFNIYQ